MRLAVDLSFVEYYVMAVLSEQPGHAMRMSNLAVLASSELSRLSHLMIRLEKRGLVVKAAPGHVDQARHLVFDVLDETEQHALKCALTKILPKLIGNCQPEK